MSQHYAVDCDFNNLDLGRIVIKATGLNVGEAILLVDPDGELTATGTVAANLGQNHWHVDVHGNSYRDWTGRP